MVRKLIKSLLSLSLIAPLSAFAIGLGEIHLHSVLSERLQADIELLSVSPSEADSLEVNLASQDTFAKVGLERPAILMYLQFEVVKGDDGEYTIKVTSKEPISEPFLDFLVEVDWKSGRVLRQYTLLLDPPGGYMEAAPAVTAPATTVATPAATTPPPVAAPAATLPSTDTTAAETELSDYAEVAEIAEEQVAESTTTEASSVGEAESTDIQSPARAESAESQVAPIAPVPAGSIVYGPVKSSDTLWAIASKLRPNNDVTVQQMMLALLKANPYAFSDNNINRLKRGYVLRIDDPSILNSMGKADAVREVARQTRAWQDYRESVAARAKQRPAKVSAVEPAPGVATAAKKEPKLKLVAPKGKGEESAAAAGTAEEKTPGEVSEELMLAMESSAAQRKENAALKKRLSALEGQLEDMEKIITLKDADLKALQDQLRKQGTELPAKQPASEMAVEEKPELIVKPEETVAAADTPEKPAAESVAATEEALKAEGTTPEVVKPAEVKKPEVKKPVEKKPAAKKKRKVVLPPPEPPKSFIEEMLEDTMMLGIAGGVLVFLLILVLLLIKRRRKGGFQESILNVGGTSSMMKASDEQGSETSFLSDLAISGMGPGTIQTDEGEADPLTEAEVFMAYGRTQQAEEVLRKAREVSPNRTDIAAKLLEVYYTAKDSEKFEALAEEAVGALQGDDALWGKVLAMGHEICPENVLFEAGAGAAAPAADTAAESAAGNVMDIGLDLDELSAEMEGEGGGDMDLDLGLDFDDIAEGGGEAAAEEAPSDELDMDLGDFGLDEAEAAAEESTELDMDLGALDLDAAPEAGGSEDVVLDFDLDLGAAEEAEPAADEVAMDFDLDLGAPDEAASEEAGEDMEFDLGDFGSTAEETSPAADDELAFDLDMGELTTEAEEGAGDMSLDMDMDLGDLGASVEVADDSVSMDLDAALDDLGSLDDLGDLGDLDGGDDEMTTKLDLAQAYAEMGDAEGARSMLEEVIAGGSDEQQQQAQALIDKL